jgi:RNA polymerase sigma-70 factor (ECF subfamily)
LIFFQKYVTFTIKILSFKVKAPKFCKEVLRMDDRAIVDLYIARSERAISETEKKYGRYCRYIASNILHSDTEAEECVDDAYMNTWYAIPPAEPRSLRTFVGRITRNLALGRYQHKHAQKRYSGSESAIEEIGELISAPEESLVDTIALRDGLNEFLGALTRRSRIIFVKRYWYLASIKEIAADVNASESSIKVSLHRTRCELKEFLKKKGITI